MKRHKDFNSEYVDSRHVDVWLPPNYESDKEKRYPVLYMHDGQNLFDESSSYIGVAWDVDETMTKLIEQDKIREAIVVGIWNTSKRFREYMPEEPVDMLNNEQRELMQDDYGTVLSDNYLKFMVNELKPFIDNEYRILADAPNTFIMGSSMGGLISWYALAKYPGVFSGAGCLSTHWPAGNEETDGQLPETVIQYFQESIPRPGSHKIYFDYGTETLDAKYEPYQKRIDSIMQEIGYQNGEDWITKKFEGHEHSERSWAARLNYPLEFLLGK